MADDPELDVPPEGNLRVSFPAHSPLTAYCYYKGCTIVCDDDTLGLALWGYDGLRSGDFVVYRYDGEIGYQTVSVWHNPIAEVINDSRPARVQVRDYVGWDGFPMIDLDNPSMVELELHTRQFDITYVWNSYSSNFMEVDKTEIFREIAVANHFLKTLQDRDPIGAAQFIDERVHFLYPVLWEDFEPLLSRDSFGRHHAAEVYADLIGYTPKYSENLVAIVAADQDRKWRYSFEDEDIESIAIFELTEEEPFKILAVYVYNVSDTPASAGR